MNVVLCHLIQISSFFFFYLKVCCINPITYGGRVFKTRIAFDALLDPLRVQIERWYYLTNPKHTYRSV
jgi:hypothetical protein